jgi:hypothetical protein
MDTVQSVFHYLGDSRAVCSCAFGENVRNLINVDSLGHHYGYYAGEFICFCLYAQRRLFHHFVGVLYCYLGLVTGFERSGHLPWSDTWGTLLLDLPRLAVVLYFLAITHRLLRWMNELCCRKSDRWQMGARLRTLHVAEYYNSVNDDPKEAIEKIIETQRKVEYDVLFEYLLISPRYVWNGFPFGKIRNGVVGKIYLMCLWCIYVCPFIFRAAMLLSRVAFSPDWERVYLINFCSDVQITLLRKVLTFSFVTFTMAFFLIWIPTTVDKKTRDF